jgi:hypothetical protein
MFLMAAASVSERDRKAIQAHHPSVRWTKNPKKAKAIVVKHPVTSTMNLPLITVRSLLQTKRYAQSYIPAAVQPIRKAAFLTEQNVVDRLRSSKYGDLYSETQASALLKAETLLANTESVRSGVMTIHPPATSSEFDKLWADIRNQCVALKTKSKTTCPSDSERADLNGMVEHRDLVARLFRLHQSILQVHGMVNPSEKVLTGWDYAKNKVEEYWTAATTEKPTLEVLIGWVADTVFKPYFEEPQMYKNRILSLEFEARTELDRWRRYFERVKQALRVCLRNDEPICSLASTETMVRRLLAVACDPFEPKIQFIAHATIEILFAQVYGDSYALGTCDNLMRAIQDILPAGDATPSELESNVAKKSPSASLKLDLFVLNEKPFQLAPSEQNALQDHQDAYVLMGFYKLMVKQLLLAPDPHPPDKFEKAVEHAGTAIDTGLRYARTGLRPFADLAHWVHQNMDPDKFYGTIDSTASPAPGTGTRPSAPPATVLNKGPLPSAPLLEDPGLPSGPLPSAPPATVLNKGPLPSAPLLEDPGLPSGPLPSGPLPSGPPATVRNGVLDNPPAPLVQLFGVKPHNILL